MLVLTRRPSESIVIDLHNEAHGGTGVTLKENLPGSHLIVIRVLSAGESFVRLGIDAPEHVRVYRNEIYSPGDGRSA